MKKGGIKVLEVGKFYPPHRGGMETHLHVLVKGLRKHIDVEVLVASENRGSREDLVEGVHVRRLGTALQVNSTSFCPELAARIGKTDADLVHIHLPNPAAVASYLVSGYKGPVVATYHSDIVRQKLTRWLISPLMNHFLEKCSSILVTSQRYAQTSAQLARHLDRCRIVPFGISTEPYLHADEAAVAGIRRAHGDRIVFAVGRMVPYKGFDYLVEAMASVRGVLLLGGSGPLQPALERKAARLGIGDRVVFTGDLTDEDLRACYHASDVFVLPSTMRSEAFGLVQIEAMASGLPVVNTQLDSGVPFISLHEQTGFTVPPRDASALASAIGLLLDRPDLRMRYGSMARQRAVEIFSLGPMISQTLEIFAAVADGRQAAKAAETFA